MTIFSYSVQRLHPMIPSRCNLKRFIRQNVFWVQHASHRPYSFDPTKLDPSLISSMGSCMEVASLSPFLPVSDEVSFKMLEMANASKEDIHYELGSGDGRVNLRAINSPFSVKKSVGIEIDVRLIEISKERTSNTSNVTFHLADLMDSRHFMWREMEEEASVVTMYFVQNALLNIRESLEKVRKPGCRIVTCGYPIPSWKPDQVEKKMGLMIYLYKG